jgi:hypothetical protein
VKGTEKVPSAYKPPSQYAGSVAFLDGANPMLGAALVPGPLGLPLVVVVVDDTDDDELVAVMAEENNVPADGYGGAWAAQVAQDGLTIKFLLIRRGASWERTWTYPDPPDEMLDAITQGEHHVAVLPRELAGNLEDFNPHSLAGAVFIDAQPSESVAAARAARR